MDRLKNKRGLIDKFKYPLIILIVGIVLMLMPTPEFTGKEGDSALELVLEDTRGVGEVRAIVSEHGAVIVCEGADQANVRLDVTRAVKTYTGFSSDKITILKMS